MKKIIWVLLGLESGRTAEMDSFTSSKDTMPCPFCSLQIMANCKTNCHHEVTAKHREQTPPPHPQPPNPPNPLCGRLASASHFLFFRLAPWTWAERGLCSPAERSKRWEPSSSSTLVWITAKISEAAAALLHSHCKGCFLRCDTDERRRF